MAASNEFRATPSPIRNGWYEVLYAALRPFHSSNPVINFDPFCATYGQRSGSEPCTEHARNRSGACTASPEPGTQCGVERVFKCQYVARQRPGSESGEQSGKSCVLKP